jgi:hypothetical protein
MSSGLARAEPWSGVEIEIHNVGEAPMRCLLVLAHWVTIDVPIVPGGARRTVALRRQSGDGALFLPRADGRRMMVENLLCGEDRRWWETRGEVPLLPLRKGAVGRLEATCRVDARVRCVLPEPPRESDH